MFSRRGFLSSVLVVSCFLSLMPPVAADSGPAVSTYFAAPSGSYEVLLAPAGSGGQMLAATTGSSFVSFSLFAADSSSSVEPLVSFDLAMGVTPSDLAPTRLLARSPAEAFLLFERDGAVRVAGFDPVAGMERFDVAISAAGERGQMPSGALVGGSLFVSFLGTSASARSFVVAQIDTADGRVLSRAEVATSSARSAALVLDGERAYLALLSGSGLELYSLDEGALTPSGSLAITAYGGALWSRHGALGAVFSTAEGLVRASALLPDLRQPSQVQIAPAPPSWSVAAQASWDGRIAAVAVGSSTTTFVRENSLSQYQVAVASGVRSAAAATDAFGLARAAVLDGTFAASSVRGFTAGTESGIAVAVAGPSTVTPLQTAPFEVTLRAVRTAVTVVGLVAAAPSGWQAQVSDVYTSLQPGDTHTVTMRVTAPAGAPGGAYSISLKPASLEVSSPEPVAFTVSVAQGPALAAAVAGGSVSFKPGESHVVLVEIQNRGATPQVAAIEGTAPSGFSIDPPTLEFTLAAGATIAVPFTVTAPAGARPMDGGSIVFDVRADDGSATVRLLKGAAVASTFEPVLIAQRISISGAPGSTIAIPFEVENRGNSAGLIYLSALTEGLPDGALAMNTQVLVVPAFGRASPGMTVTLPPNALWGRGYALAVTAAREDGSAVGRAAFTGTVLEAVAVSGAFDAGEAVAPGGTATGSLTLVNSGNRALVASLVFLPSQNGVTPRVGTGVSGGIVVPAFSQLMVPIEFVAGERAAAGRLAPVVRVDTDAGPSFEVPMSVTVLPSHRLTLAVLTPSLTVTDPAVTSVAAEFEVYNGGNVAELVNLVFARAPSALGAVSADGRVQALDPLEPLDLPAFSGVHLRAVLPLALAPSATATELALRAESHSGMAAEGAVAVSRPLADPRLVDLSVNPFFTPAHAGDLHRVVANLANDGGSTSTALVALLSVDGRVVLEQPVDPLPRGARRLIAFEFVPIRESQDVAVILRTQPAGFDSDPSNNGLAVTYAVALPQAPPSTAEKAAGPAVVSFSLLALIAVALTEFGKSTLISLLFVPLYVKLKPQEVLDQYLRGQIHAYIIASPGEHYNAIKEQLGVTNGALAYHLRVLERSGYIRAVRDGMYKRFYPMGVKIPKRRRLSVFQEVLVKTVRDNPALSQKEIAERLGVSNQVINYHVKQLETANILRLERDGRGSHLFLGPEAPPADPAAPAPAATPAPSP